AAATAGTTGAAPAAAAGATEAPDTGSVTTVKEYKFVPAEKLPPVKGVSQYKWNEADKTFRFTYNVWAGWLPVIAANHGTKANDDSVFKKKYGFKVEMVLMDDPVAARDAYAAGDVHSMWGTVDMLVLFAPELIRDSRTAPRIVQQIDWSNGGDGIVVRKTIKSVKDLKGRTVALAQNSPSEYYITSLLLSAGMKPADIKPKYTATAFEAAAAFVSDPSIDACVSWAPDIYNIADRVANAKILSTTSDANKLIADVYAIRADFVRDHPDVVEGLIAGILEGMDQVKKDPTEACAWMADAFGMKPEDVMNMRNDSHPTNAAENAQFFLNSSNPTNFERTWKNAAYVYRELGRINAPAAFDQVMDFTFVQKVIAKGGFTHQKDESIATFTPGSVKTIQAEAPILTQTIRINFFPNSANPFEPAHDEYGNVQQGKLYDPNVGSTLEQVGRLAGQFARATILIQGHADDSMRGKIPEKAVKDLSTERAQAIKRALIEKYKFEPDKFVVEGKGWDEAAEPSDPHNHALNRRVEISVYPPEQK
ncbi:MAG: ABC transporter substrate-binding protein, partial [Planctomycetes bacterium]|nr:ABC transporter substrate-binding protein [Planctomycetota bacterium]